MSFVSEYNLGRDASTTSFLASLVRFLWDTSPRCLFTLLDRQRRKRAVRIVGMDTSGAVAWRPIIPFPSTCARCLWQNSLALSQYSCHGTHFMLLFAYIYAVHLTARMSYPREM
jgi:hypothetical protein